MILLHILRKDIRHLFSEILLSLILTAALAYAAPAQWGFPIAGSLGFFGVEGFIAPFLRILLPLAWLVLIAGLVHDESLVGDRQFWITRPYTWPTLLAEKALFVLLFLHLPLLLMQLYLLHHASLDIPPAFPDLLLFHLRLLALLVLPFFAIATVTATFGRQLITVLAGIAYIAVLATFSFRLLGRRTLAPGLDTVLLTLFAALLLAIILFQYGTRRARLARPLLAAVPAMILLLILIAPNRRLIEHAFPTASNAAEQLSFDADPNREEPGPAGQLLLVNGSVILNLPVLSRGLPPGTRLKGKAVSIDIRTPDGFHWTSPFEDTGADLYGGSERPSVDVLLPLSVFNRIRNTPVDLGLTLALNRFSTQAPQTIAAAQPAFPVPGRGTCPLADEGSVPNCLFPLRLPAPIDTKVRVADQPCLLARGENPGALAQPKVTTISRFLGSDDDHLAFDLDPVDTSPLNLTFDPNSTGMAQPAYLCPGAPLTFTPHLFAGRERLAFTQHAVTLGLYAKSHALANPSHVPPVPPNAPPPPPSD